jgi:CPA2 family monovalent cation:H+ antiporter-2
MDIAILSDLAVVFGAAIAIAILIGPFRIPYETGFILAGCLIGPNVLALVKDIHRVEAMAELGVILLLFGIGMDLPLDRIKLLWKPILLGGALQVSGTSLAVFGIVRVFGMPWQVALLIALMLAVSSTAVVLRCLEERSEIDAPHGRLALGILVFQDMCVVPMLLAIPFLGGKGADLAGGLAALGKGVLVLGAAVILSRKLVPAILGRVALTQRRDLFVLAVSFLCIGTAWLTSLVGMPLAAGAFISGLIVARSDFRHQALSDVIPFREVFTSFFFVSIGMLLDPMGALRAHGIILSGLVGILVLKFLVIFVVGIVLRLPLRVSILAGALLSQVGEFAFVLSRAGEAEGILPATLTGSLTSIVILSMLITPLIASFGPTIAAGAGRIGALTRFMDVDTPVEQESFMHNHAIIAGYGVSGQVAASALRESGVPLVVLDLNPDNVRAAEKEGHLAFFGDVTSPTVLGALGIHRARVLLVVVNDPEAAARAIRSVRSIDSEIEIVVRGRYLGTAPLLYSAGATMVISAELEASIEVTAHLLRMYEIPEDEVERQREMVRSRSCTLPV